MGVQYVGFNINDPGLIVPASGVSFVNMGFGAGLPLPAFYGIGTPQDLGNASAATGAGTVAIAITNNIQVGDVVVVVGGCATSSNGLTSVADDAGNSYATSVNLQGTLVAPSANIFVGIATAPLAAGNHITGTFGGTTGAKGIVAFRVPRMLLNWPLVWDSAVIPISTNGTAVNGGTVNTGTLSQANELLVGEVGASGNPGAMSATGFTAISATTANYFINVFYKIVASTASVAWSPTWVNSVAFRSNVRTLRGWNN